MTMEPDSVAEALADTAQHMFGTVSAGWLHRGGGLWAGTTGVPIATMNGIWTESSHPDARTVAEMLVRLAASGLPYCVQLRPGTPDEIADQARSRGMAHHETIPLMVLEDPTRITDTPIDGLSIRVLSPEEGYEHVRIAANAFGTTEELFGQVVSPKMLGLTGLRCYLGEVDGEPVTTGMGVTLGSSVAIFNIATLSPHRGRGYGAAITARVASEGPDAGAKWAWLQSSPAGYRVYERLGFRTLERWDCWVSQA